MFRKATSSPFSPKMNGRWGQRMWARVNVGGGIACDLREKIQEIEDPLAGHREFIPPAMGGPDPIVAASCRLHQHLFQTVDVGMWRRGRHPPRDARSGRSPSRT